MWIDFPLELLYGDGYPPTKRGDILPPFEHGMDFTLLIWIITKDFKTLEFPGTVSII